MKIIINSHAGYEKPLNLLFNSMIDAGFTDFADEVILVVGGAKKNRGPKRRDISKIFPTLPSIICTVILTRMNNFEYTGFHMLHVHRDHVLVRSTRYLFLMDTCTVGRFFMKKYKRCKEYVPLIEEPNWIHSVSNRYVSNICLFSRNVVLLYGDNFKKQLTKEEAIKVEGGRKVRGVKPLWAFGHRLHSSSRRSRKHKRDIYGTGEIRTGFWYPIFGVIKWVFLGGKGDVLGKPLSLGATETDSESGH